MKRRIFNKFSSSNQILVSRSHKFVLFSRVTRCAGMRRYNSARGDINIKRPHPRRTKIADKIFIVRPGGGGLVHCQIALLHFEFLHRPILELSLPFLLPILRIMNFRMFRGKWKTLDRNGINCRKDTFLE